MDSCVMMHQLTRDAAMNPVMASATFDVSKFLADNVGIVATRADMPPTFQLIINFEN